jgi:hypothetical protein
MGQVDATVRRPHGLVTLALPGCDLVSPSPARALVMGVLPASQLVPVILFMSILLIIG